MFCLQPLILGVQSAAGICLYMWTLIWFPDCTQASSESDDSYWHVLSLLCIPWMWFSFFFVTRSNSSEQYLFTVFHSTSCLSILVLPFPVVSSPPFPLSFVYTLGPHHLPHLTPFIPHCPSRPPHFPSCFSLPSPPLFPVSVEPLRLHRYSDCRLCRGGGMLFRHSIRRYCTTCTLPHTIKSPAACSKTFINITLAYKHDLWPGCTVWLLNDAFILSNTDNHDLPASLAFTERLPRSFIFYIQ